MDDKDTLVAVQDLLMRSWRERLTDIQWSIQMKKVLKGASIDGYRLCEMILSQMFVGPNPSGLLTSYLKHSICTQLVSHVAVLQSLVKYEDTCVNRPYCMKSLLEVLQVCITKINCHGPPEECLQIAVALLQVILWLMKSICLSMEKIMESKTTQNVISRNLEQSCDLLHTICTRDRSRMMLVVARLEDEALWSQLEQEIATAKNIVNNAGGSPRGQGNMLEAVLNTPRSVSKDSSQKETIRERLERYLGEALNVPNVSYSGKYQIDTHTTVAKNSAGSNCCLTVMVHFETLLGLTNEPQVFVDQVLLLEKLQSISRSDVYMGLCHGTLQGLLDEDLETTEQLRWFAFSFLKLPQIFSHLKQNPSQTDQAVEDPLVMGMEQLLQYNTLIDMVDTKHQFDFIKEFSSQLVKSAAITSNEATDLINKRSSSRHIGPNYNEGTVSHFHNLIIAVEPTIPTVLSNLESETRQNTIDEVPDVLVRLLSSNCFDIVVASSAATSKLKHLGCRLAKFNDIMKQHMVDGSKSSFMRAASFDITFLMLCLISQQYVVEIVISNEEETFFETWAQQSFPDDCGAKPLFNRQYDIDMIKVKNLLTLFLSNGDFKTIQMRFEEICQAVPILVQQTLTAWEQEIVNTEQVQKIVDGLCGNMGCLAIIAMAWLFSKLNALGNVEGTNAYKFVRLLAASCNSASANYGGLGVHDNERFYMMKTIINKMLSGPQIDCNPNPRPQPVLSVTPSSEAFTAAFDEAYLKKALTKSVRERFTVQLTAAGVGWFCWQSLMEMLKLQRKDDLRLAAELSFALFQVDIEQFTIALLRKVLPRLIADKVHPGRITDPRGRMLAKLTVWCIASTLTTQNSCRDPKLRENPNRTLRVRKRTRGEIDRDNGSMRDEGRQSKLRRLLSMTDEETANSSMSSVFSNVGHYLVPQTQFQLSDPLTKAIASLMQLLASIYAEGTMSGRTEFIYSFLQEILLCGNAVSSCVLQFMPITMANQLFSTIYGVFLQDLALAIGQLDSVDARRQAARALCISRR